MGSRSLFAMRVIRCPACHARLPVESGQSVVQCEYCDAHVQLGGPEPKNKKKKPKKQPAPVMPLATPTPTASPFADAPPTHVAQPQYSGCAWVVFIVPLLTVLGVGFSMFVSMGLTWRDVEIFWHDLTHPGPPSRTAEQVSEPAGGGSKEVEDEPHGSEGDDEDETEAGEVEEAPGRVGRLFSTLSERAEEADAKAEQERAAARRRTRAAAARKPSDEPSGPVLSVAEAKAALEPEVRKCMKSAKVHHVTARMGNAKEGGVSILMSGVVRPRVDGSEVNLPGTPLGRCMNEAGSRVRTRAFKGNAIVLDVRNPDMPNPLGHLPQDPPFDRVDAAIASFDAQIQACAREHDDLNRHEIAIQLQIDGPTGTLRSAKGLHMGKAFDGCAEAAYRKGTFPKAQRHVYGRQRLVRRR